MTHDAPTVGIVVPVGPGASGVLSSQLQALAAQQDAPAAQVVLSCNGEPTAAVDRVAAEIDWPAGWTWRTVDSSAVRGPAAARNDGWRALDTDLVLFCDADDEVDPRWCAAMTAALREHAICGAALRFDRVNPPDRWEVRRKDRLDVPFGHLPHTGGATLGARRSLLAELDGFDADLRAAEDTDLCWRAAYAGHPLHFVPDAVVDCRLKGTVRQTFRNGVLFGEGDAVLLAKHRAHGARWSPRSGARQLGSTVKALLLAPFGLRRRRIMAERAGLLVGRLKGSVRTRTFVV